MRKSILAAIAVTTCGLAFAHTGIDGTWRTDLKTISGGEAPSKYVVKDGMYECQSCTPQIKVKADGTEQPVQGNPFLDGLAVKVVDDHTIEVTSTKGGKVITSGKITVESDGNTMTREFTTHDAKGFVNTSTTKMARVGAPVKKAHATTGTWKLVAVEKMTDNGVRYKVSPGAITMYATDGSSYQATVDGKKVPFKDSPGSTAVSVKMKDNNTLEETDWRGDTAWFVMTTVVAPDGKTAKVTWENKLNKTRGGYTMIRQ